MGVKAGVPDIFIEVPKGGYHGFRAEFKASKPHNSAVQKTQKEWINKLNDQGYYAIIAVGIEQLKLAVIDYLEMGVTNESE